MMMVLVVPIISPGGLPVGLEIRGAAGLDPEGAAVFLAALLKAPAGWSSQVHEALARPDLLRLVALLRQAGVEVRTSQPGPLRWRCPVRGIAGELAPGWIRVVGGTPQAVARIFLAAEAAGFVRFPRAGEDTSFPPIPPREGPHGADR